jgi:hypothetical protein
MAYMNRHPQLDGPAWLVYCDEHTPAEHTLRPEGPAGPENPNRWPWAPDGMIGDANCAVCGRCFA